MTQTIDAKRQQMDRLLQKLDEERQAVIAKRDELNALLARMTGSNRDELGIPHVTDELTQLTGRLSETTRAVGVLLDEINAAKNNEKENAESQPLTRQQAKDLMNQESKWELQSFIAIEDLYTVRCLKGRDTGVTCYVVMLGGTVLSTHFSEQEALENWNAWLNGECAADCDTWEIDGF